MNPSDQPLPFRPDQVGGGLQLERTALAWERTTIAMMVAGAVLAHHSVRSFHFALGLIGVAQVVAGGLILAWALRNDQDLHDPSAPATAVPQTAMTRLVGLGSVAFTAAALILGLLSL